MRIPRQAVRALILLLAIVITSVTARAQTQSGCLPPAQSSSGPVSITLWCQVLDYSPAAPLSVNWDTGFITLQRAITMSYFHIQYDPWYAAMDSTFQFEFLTSHSDVITFPFTIPYDGVNPYTADIPLGVPLAAGDRIRVFGGSSIPHTCNLIDNCGMHVVFTFQ